MALSTQVSPAVSVIEEYRALVDKAYKKFSRLRDFPLYGHNKWGHYFQKAFRVYTRLWKFQQDNRQKLLEAGLRRWEIGDIASRIGQLYYIYYLKTSDATFLSESFIFYDAILNREYFKDTGKDASLLSKHLRFYARFIIICLLLNKRDMVNQLAKKLNVLVDEYCSFMQAADAKEWKSVYQEISRFLKADLACAISRPLRYSLVLDGHPSSFPIVRQLDGRAPLKLHSAILVSYYHSEVKFSEMTLENFRMLQSIEWEPSGAFYRSKSPENAQNYSPEMTLKRANIVDEIKDPTLPPNPEKHILYRPSIPRLLLVLATACEEVPLDSIILLYVSASAKASRGTTQSGGVPTCSDAASSVAESEVELSSSSTANQDLVSETRGHMLDPVPEQCATSSGSTQETSPCNCGPGGDHAISRSLSASNTGLWLGSRRCTGANYLYPSDILPFTRRPLFIIIDSDNSSVFETISGEERGAPAILLLSPVPWRAVERPTSASALSHNEGKLFTTFLTAPLLAFCRLAGLSMNEIQQGLYEQAEKVLSGIFIHWNEHLSSSISMNITWARVLADPFLRRFLLRFIFCYGCYRLNELHRTRYSIMPRCYPALPEDFLLGEWVPSDIRRIAKLFGVDNQFLTSKLEGTYSYSSNISGNSTLEGCDNCSPVNSPVSQDYEAAK